MVILPYMAPAISGAPTVPGKHTKVTERKVLQSIPILMKALWWPLCQSMLPATALIYTENFSARYRLQKTPLGTYIFTVGGDDGYRLSLDGGGNTWVIDKWQDQGYNITSYTAVLKRLRNIVLEYYENGGENRISFDMNSSNTLPVTLRAGLPHSFLPAKHN